MGGLRATTTRVVVSNRQWTFEDTASCWRLQTACGQPRIILPALLAKWKPRQIGDKVFAVNKNDKPSWRSKVNDCPVAGTGSTRLAAEAGPSAARKSTCDAACSYVSSVKWTTSAREQCRCGLLPTFRRLAAGLSTRMTGNKRHVQNIWNQSRGKHLMLIHY